MGEGSRRTKLVNHMPSEVSPEPTIGALIATNGKLRIACTRCAKAKELSAWEAVASYGGLMRFAEIQTVLKARCRSKPCVLSVVQTT